VEKIKQQAYDAYVKRKQLKKGKGSYISRGYKKANKEPLTKEAAYGRLMSLLDTYANRSGMIKKSNRLAKRRADLEARYRQLAHKFRTKKGNKNIIVEKTKYAIDSFQELQDITFEGIKARKKQELIGRISNLIIKQKKRKKQQALLNLFATKKSSADIFLKSKKSKRGVKWFS